MNRESERPRKKRMHLTMKSKQEICQRKQVNPSLTIDQFITAREVRLEKF
jgi:hypothetical protein